MHRAINFAISVLLIGALALFSTMLFLKCIEQEQQLKSNKAASMRQLGERDQRNLQESMRVAAMIAGRE